VVEVFLRVAPGGDFAGGVDAHQDDGAEGSGDGIEGAAGALGDAEVVPNSDGTVVLARNGGVAVDLEVEMAVTPERPEGTRVAPRLPGVQGVVPQPETSPVSVRAMRRE